MKMEKSEENPSKVTFEEIYKITYPSVFNTVKRRYARGDYDLAKDYCQIGYIRVSANFHKYSGKGNLEGWVRRVVTNTILTEMKKKKLEIVDTFDFERNETEDIPYSEEWIGGSITTEDIIESMKDLPETYKRVFTLHYFENKTVNEIAGKLGTHPGTQRAYLFRARKMVKEKLEEIIEKNNAI